MSENSASRTYKFSTALNSVVHLNKSIVSPFQLRGRIMVALTCPSPENASRLHPELLSYFYDHSAKNSSMWSKSLFAIVGVASFGKFTEDMFSD